MKERVAYVLFQVMLGCSFHGTDPFNGFKAATNILTSIYSADFWHLCVNIIITEFPMILCKMMIMTIEFEIKETLDLRYVYLVQ